MKMSPWVRWVLVGVGVLLIAKRASATTPSTDLQPPTAGSGALIEEGVASFYGGPFFQGKLTASGVPFDENQMMAAHRTLKFGTNVRVTDLETGGVVDVVIRDRGPFPRDSTGKFTRCIDLSSGAARVMGLDIQRGLARVRLERI